MKFSDNEIPNDVVAMYDEIFRMKNHDDLIKSVLTEYGQGPSGFIALAYCALRQREMWRDSLYDVKNDLKKAVC